MAGDLYWANVSALLHMDGIAGSTSFPDSSGLNVFTANGSAAVETTAVQAGFGTGALATYAGSVAGFLTAPHTASLDLTTGDFTVECEFYYIPGAFPNILLTKETGTGNYPWQIYLNSSGNLAARGLDSGLVLYSTSGAGVITSNAWHHAALVRIASTFTLYLDGVVQGTYSTANALYGATDPFVIGAYGTGAYPLTGYIDEVRITKGVGRYTAAFTPPTSAFPNTGIVSGAALAQQPNTTTTNGGVAISGSAASTQQLNVVLSGIALGAALTQQPSTTTANGAVVVAGSAAPTQQPNSAATSGGVAISGSAASTQQLNVVSASSGPLADPYIANVSLLLNCDGTNGSTIFPDTSPRTKTVTASGVTVSTVGVQWGGASAFYGLTNFGNTLTVPDNADFNLSSGDFTLEAWVYFPSGSDPQTLATNATIAAKRPAGAAQIPWQFFFNTTGHLTFQATDGNAVVVANITAIAAVTNSTWHFVQARRSGDTFAIAMDGVQKASVTATAGVVLSSLSSPVTIGNDQNGNTVSGYLDDIRITQGVARAFAVPTQAFPGYIATAPTGSIATTQAANSLSALGATQVSGAAASTQQLNTVAAAGGVTNSGSVFGPGAVTQVANTASALGGPVLSGSAAATQVASTGSGAGLIGGPSGSAAIAQTPYYGYAFGRVRPVGWIADPYIANVSLLIQANGTDGSTAFIDTSPRAKVITVYPNASISTTAPKWGTGCYLSSTGGALSIGASADFNLGASDFTVEGWANVATLSTARMILCEGVFGYLYTGSPPVISGLGGFQEISLEYGTLTAKSFDASNSPFGGISGSVVPTNAWFHWAYVRSGASFFLFLNGVQVGTTATSSASYPVPDFGPMIGAFYSSGSTTLGNFLIGELDDIRLTNGVARYVANFTPPAAEFAAPDIVSTGTAAQTLPVFVQGATAVDPDSVNTSQTPLIFGQAATLSGVLSRLVSSSTTFLFDSTGSTAIVVNGIRVPFDPSFSQVLYLLHCDLEGTAFDSTNHLRTTVVDSSTFAPAVFGSLCPVSSDPLAISGSCVTFTPQSGSGFATLTKQPSTYYVTTTELRVRFDKLTATIYRQALATGYMYDDTQQQTGWFYSTSIGFTFTGSYNPGIKLGLAGANGLYEADVYGFNANYPSITLKPYVLQLKGYILLLGGSYTVNYFGTHEVLPGWHDISMISDGTTVSVYLDGVLDITFPLQAGSFPPFNETFAVGADISGGSFDPGHTNLSAVQEMRHTYGATRYPTGLRTQRFLDANLGLLLPFNQVSVTYNGFSATAGQTVQPFAQVATVTGQMTRSLGATQQMDLFIQAASVLGPVFGIAQNLQLAALGQDASATTNPVNALTITQVATAVHTGSGVAANQAFALTQNATAAALITLTQGQIILSLSQSAQLGEINMLQSAQTLVPFAPSSYVQGAFISASERRYLVRPETRTFTTPTQN